MDVTEALRSWAKDNHITVNLEAETAKFLSWHAARGNTFNDWNQAWRNWMLRAQDWAPKASPGWDGQAVAVPAPVEEPDYTPNPNGWGQWWPEKVQP
ncbi:hypothetical protein SB659_07680 [Arthrobacter sp. SIMBA_036]|uniref:hypothetical protein n=1 Tax=Arthrobacter sp. SIMBA_036 TaxID=3085778 RepID=UPI0039796BB0